MKAFIKILCLLPIFAFVLFQPACKEEVTEPEPLNDFHLSFVNGSIGASLMPFVPPDPITCRIVLIAKNNNQANVINIYSISQADVYLGSTNEKLGTITFNSNWDGKLEPNESDTVDLKKISSSASLFYPPCNKYVYLNLLVRENVFNSIEFKTDSLYFGCVY